MTRTVTPLPPVTGPAYVCEALHRTPYNGGPPVIRCPFPIAAHTQCSRNARVEAPMVDR